MLPLLAASQTPTTDTLQFGNAASEQLHAFSGSNTAVIKGGLGELCRKILQPKTPSWQSEPMTFKLKINPKKRNYITVKFWGSDISHDHLLMLIDGKQMGYMHLGDYDLLDYETCEPRDVPLSANPNPQYLGRFTYTTFLLPEIATKEKKEIQVSIRAVGKIWGYGNDFQQFQKNVSQDSRGIYAVYIHDTPFFQPTDAELAKITISPPSQRTDAPKIDLNLVKTRVNEEIRKCLEHKTKRDVERMVLLAEAYHVSWSAAWHNRKAVEFVIDAIDELARRYVKEPNKVVTAGSWTGCASQAKAVILLEQAIQPFLDKCIDNGQGKQVKRRDLWFDMFEASTFQLVHDRRWLANQSQIVDNSGHLNNRAAQILYPGRGIPLKITLQFVKEALGILPWSHGINPNLTSASTGKNDLGSNYRELTKNYLSKELGYVGNYGESTIWASADIYESTIDRQTGKGDPEIFKVMEKAALARTIFRYPSVTVRNHPVMRLEVYIDWRNAHFPGEPSYVGRGLDLRTIYYTQNAVLLGGFKDMLKDGYFQDRVAAEVAPENRNPDFIGLLHLPERFSEISRDLSKIDTGMPMRGKNFVFADEEIGVLALKNGDDILFAELFWRANRGINNLAKIHYLTSKSEHVATVYQDEEFIPSGRYSTEPDWVIYGFRPPRFAYPGGYYHQLRAGEKLPIAETYGDRTLVGKAEFYRCSYGPYEIGMNYSRKNKTYRMKVPDGEYRVLPDGPTVHGGTSMEVKPETTLVLYRIDGDKR